MGRTHVTFTKMHGLGNDFVVINRIAHAVEIDAARARLLADRRRGIGCDQILLVEPAREAGTDFSYRIFNPDGSEVEQCGNGARCLARFAYDAGIANGPEMRAGYAAGVIDMQIRPDGQVRVGMGAPRLAPADLPMAVPERGLVYALEAGDRQYEISAVSMGNPHAVMIVEDVDTAPVGEIGPLIERHALFPERVNVGFMQVLDRGRIRLRVHERGAGETPACGSGACAAVVAGRLRGLLDERVEVGLPGGRLSIQWQGEGSPVWMTGPATRVFEGKIEL